MYTLQGKTRSTRHTLSTLDPCRVLNHTSHVVHVGNLLLVPRGQNRPLHPGEILAIKDRLARPSSWVTSFPLPHDSLGVGERGFDQVVTQLHQLIGLIYQHAIDTSNACLWGPTNRSLTDTDGGYNLRGVSFPHTTPWPSHPAVSTFHLRAPPGLELSIQSLPKDQERE
jgi:hypothetical protein